MDGINKIERVLITGGTGLLGIALQQSAPADVMGFFNYLPSSSSPVGLPFPAMVADVTDNRQMEAVFKWAMPDVVIHTAAIGSVDFAEKNREETRKVNLEGTKIVAALCDDFQALLIYISSNAVFDGRTPFYSETSPVNPINYYGQLKVEAENVVRDSCESWAIVRPILMYGWPHPGERDNPVVWWVRSLENGSPIKVVDNVFSKPLPVWSCAEVIWQVIRQGRTGIYHAAGRDHLSLYQFALHVADVFSLDAKLITPVPDSFFPEIAPRPKDTSFDTTKMEMELGVKCIGIREGLIRMKIERAGKP